MALLRNIARFLAGSIGSPVSIKSIADYITSSGRRISPNTVSDYVEALIEPYVFYPAERYDINGKQLLTQNRKLYIVDLGLRRHLVPKQNYDLGHSLENLVYLELLRRDCKVMIGKVGNTEVDFVAQRGDAVSDVLGNCAEKGPGAGGFSGASGVCPCGGGALGGRDPGGPVSDGAFPREDRHGAKVGAKSFREAGDGVCQSLL